MGRGIHALVLGCLSLFKKTEPLLLKGWKLLGIALSSATSWTERIFLPSRTLVTAFVIIATALLMADYLVQLRNRIDVNAYYYAFSTIAQALASAFGFLVAVALYRMKAIEDGMELEFSQVIDHVADANDRDILQRMNRCHFWDDIDSFVSQAAIDALPSDKHKSLSRSKKVL